MSSTEKYTPKHLEFVQFWSFIAHELGSSRLKINPQARDIHNFFESGNDSKNKLKQAIKESYKRSHCNNLRNQISIEAVLDILGEIAHELRNNHLDDLFDIELFEEIAWHISDRYRQYLSLDVKPNDAPTGQLISFPRYKIRTANARG